MKRAILALAVAAVGPWAAADEVWLKNGGRIVGEILEHRAQAVVIDVGPGTVTVPLSRVERVVSSSSRLAEFRRRAAGLPARDVQAWLALAEWAERNDLRTQAREAREHVLAVEPGNASAQQALGNVWQGGRWMGREDALRAQGLVEYDGQWMSPAEREARQRAQAAEEAYRRDHALADARVAEAEARAREAEARARAAEAEADRADDAFDDGGIPLVGYGGIGYGVPVVVGPAVQPCCGLPHGPGLCPNGSSGKRWRPPAARPTPPPRDDPAPPRPQPQPRAARRTVAP